MDVRGMARYQVPEIMCITDLFQNESVAYFNLN